ncbi:siroheme synthase Met8 [Rhodotorula sp. JG-1b]|nr:siroheme synthase Met8 [Rhodotorula sp. JG-1b]
MSAYAPVEPTGSLLLAWQVSQQTILLIGAGTVAASRLYHLVCANPRKVIIVAPDNDQVDPEIRYRLEQQHAGGTELEWIKRPYRQHQDLDDLLPKDAKDDGLGMVLVATDDATLSSRICTECRHRRIPVNVADVPPECDFYFGSVLRRGALSVMVSTNGKGPRLAARLRRRIEKSIPEGAGLAIDKVGKLRAALRVKEPGKDPKTIERRMQWMIRVSDLWSVDQLARMDDAMRQAVLAGWESDTALGYWDVVRSRSLADRVGYLAHRAARLVTGQANGSCPVDRDPDGDPFKCPFLVGMTGFVAGLATASSIAAVVAWRYSQLAHPSTVAR